MRSPATQAATGRSLAGAPSLATFHAIRPTMSDLALAITERYAEGGAGFMHDLGLTITDAEPGRVRFTLKVTDRLVHAGGVLCGQTILACMDTGMVFVMMSLNEASDGNFTTVQLNATFERGVPGDVGEVTFDAHATKTGRSLVFGEIDLLLPDGRRAASATTTYMWLPSLAT